MKEDVVFIQTTTNNIMKNVEDSLKKDGEIILIPKLNLLSNLDNEHVYYSKLADDLIRYNRIKQFMFKTNIFLSFSDIKYDLNQDEIILLQSLLTSDYFEDLVPDISSKYIHLIHMIMLNQTKLKNTIINIINILLLLLKILLNH